MKTPIYLLILSFCFFGFVGCKTNNKTKPQKIQHKDLLWSRQYFLAEMTGQDNQYDSINAIVNKRPFDYRYLDNLIIISAYFERDACGQYKADIKINNDSLLLSFDLISEEVCTALAYYKVDYLIKTPLRNKYKIVMEK